jgi:hypothetical protein
MSLWGKSDSLFSTGTISVDLSTKVATISTGTLPAAATIEGGVVTITGKGSATIKERTGNTTFTIHNTTGLDGTPISGVAYNISDQPMYLPLDSNYGEEEIFGVDENEMQAAREDNSQYRPQHAGWVGITSYTDQHGNQRVKTECFVAGSSITGDNDTDDTILPDS